MLIRAIERRLSGISEHRLRTVREDRSKERDKNSEADEAKAESKFTRFKLKNEDQPRVVELLDEFKLRLKGQKK